MLKWHTYWDRPEGRQEDLNRVLCLCQGDGCTYKDTTKGVTTREDMNTKETESFNLMMMYKIEMRILKCWDHKAPEDFENHTPCKESKDW